MAGAQPVRHPWTQPAVLRVTSAAVPRTLNPILATQTVEGSLGRLITDVLVSADEHGNLVPRLARSLPTSANGGISRDGRTITYRLRARVRWQDGAAFTSRDVAFTVAAILNPKNDVISRHGYDLIQRVETPDPLTVVFRLKAPFAPFVATVLGESDSPYGMLPEHLLARYDSLNDVPYNAQPVGLGPFTFVRWLRGDRIEYVRNDDYYGSRPKLARISWRLVPDENTEIQLMRTHEADWLYEASENAYRSLATIPGVHAVLTNTNGYTAILMNAGHGATADVRVRLAIARSLDRERLTRALTFGVGLPATGDLPSFLWAADRSLRGQPFDPNRARALLAQAGYSAQHRLALGLVYMSGSNLARNLAVQVQASLAAIGIDVTPRAQLSSMLYGSYGSGGTLTTGKYDLAIQGWIAGIDPDDSAQLTCANRPPNGFNTSAYCSPEMDRAQAAALRSYDRPARKAAYAEIERLVVADVPLDTLWWPRSVQAINDDLRGFDPNPVTETWDAANWSI